MDATTKPAAHPRPSDYRDANLSDVVRRLEIAYRRLALVRAALNRGAQGPAAAQARPA
jgi:hypothetical protein